MIVGATLRCCGPSQQIWSCAAASVAPRALGPHQTSQTGDNTKTAVLGVPVRARDRWLVWWMTTTQANTRAQLIRISQAV